MYNLLKEGTTAAEIGRRYGASTTTISRINHGELYRRKSETYPIAEPLSSPRLLNNTELIELVSYLRDTNESYLSIGKKMGMTRKSISRINNGKHYTKRLQNLGYTSFPLRKPTTNEV